MALQPTLPYGPCVERYALVISHREAEAEGDAGWTGETSMTVVRRLAKFVPDAELAATGLVPNAPVPVPKEIVELFDAPVLRGGWTEDVAPKSLAGLASAFKRASDAGAAQCEVTLTSTGDVRIVEILNFAGEFELMLLVMHPPHEAGGLVPEAAELGPDEFQVRDRSMEHIVDEASILLRIDEVTRETLGWGDEVIGTSTIEHMHPDDLDRSVTMWVAMLSDPGGARQCRLRYRHSDGRFIWVETTNHNLLSTAGHVRREVRDISHEMQAIGAARNRELVLKSLADALPSGIAQFDTDLQPMFRNAQWDTITGSDTAQTLPETLEALGIVVPGIPDAGTGRTSLSNQSSVDLDAEGFDCTTTIPRPGDRTDRRCQLHLRPLIDDTGQFVGVVCCLDDITTSWELQNRLAAQALRDPLTGIANRSGILSALDEAQERARRTHAMTAVVFIDMNGFKRVNDQFGHAVGDRLLSEMASRLSATLRPGDIVGRQGGDEFLVVCPDVGSREGAAQVAHRLMRAATHGWTHEGNRLEIAVGCGFTVSVGGGETSERLVAEADLAMYENKRRGGPPVFFENRMFAEQRLGLRRDSALAVAVSDGSLEAHYQPIVDLKQNVIHGYEALARWTFERERVAPDIFIPVAERRGYIHDIGLWIFEQVCAAAARHPNKNLTWAVNVSPVQLDDEKFSMRLLRSLDRADVNPRRVLLEITEGSPVNLLPSFVKGLRELHDNGVGIVVDDFGTGFGTLDYLRAVPVGGLKIDKSFTAHLDEPRTHAIVASAIDLAKRLDLSVVVEGVESEYQRQAVMEMGAEFGQGWLFGRPASATRQGFGPASLAAAAAEAHSVSS